MKAYKKQSEATMLMSGAFYPTCKAAAEANGIQQGAVSARLRSGKMLRLPAGIYDTVRLAQYLNGLMF